MKIRQLALALPPPPLCHLPPPQKCCQWYYTSENRKQSRATAHVVQAGPNNCIYKYYPWLPGPFHRDTGTGGGHFRTPPLSAFLDGVPLIRGNSYIMQARQPWRDWLQRGAAHWRHTVHLADLMHERSGVDYLVVRYEDLVAEPVHTMARMLKFIGEWCHVLQEHNDTIHIVDLTLTPLPLATQHVHYYCQ